MKYQVIVGNIGTVYDGDSWNDAKRDFGIYKRKSIEGVGRASGESVVLMEDGEPRWEHPGEQDTDN